MCVPCLNKTVHKYVQGFPMKMSVARCHLSGRNIKITDMMQELIDLALNGFTQIQNLETVQRMFWNVVKFGIYRTTSVIVIMGIDSDVLVNSSSKKPHGSANFCTLHTLPYSLRIKHII